MPDIQDQYTRFLTTVRPDCQSLVVQIQEWIKQNDIPSLTIFFAQDTGSISKIITGSGYWTRYPDQEELLSSAMQLYESPRVRANLQQLTINPDGSVDRNDPLFPLLYNLIPFYLHPTMQGALWQRYEEEGSRYRNENRT